MARALGTDHFLLPSNSWRQEDGNHVLGRTKSSTTTRGNKIKGVHKTMDIDRMEVAFNLTYIALIG